MAIDLTKQVQAARIVLEKNNVADVQAHVVVLMDISGSMSYVFRSGVVQRLLQRLLAVGLNIDINKSIEVFAFNSDAFEVDSANINNVEDFVQKVFLRKISVGGGTNYAPAMKMVARKFGKDSSQGGVGGLFGKLFGKKTLTSDNTPILVFQVTDGDNFDKTETTNYIREISDQPIFWQYIGIGDSSFPFLEKLDDLSGRKRDNADFFHANDIDSISDSELYNRILNEFPKWMKEINK